MSEGKKDYMLIKLTRGLYARVDPEDFHRLNVHKWYAMKSGKTFYAVRKSKLKGGKKRKTIKMHNEVFKTPVGYEPDHINQNGLDNKKKNLRNVTHMENVRNSASRGGNSKYKGVCWHKRWKRWQANICVNYKRTFLGYFDSEKEAAIAYDDAAFERFGVYGHLNFPERFAERGMDAIL